MPTSLNMRGGARIVGGEALRGWWWEREKVMQLDWSHM